jgi:hypothetical protein
MSSFFDRLNLRPQERRLVVLSGTMFFVMLNLWFVKPHFKDWRDLGDRLESARSKLKRYQAEVDRLPEYEAKQKELESAGANVLPASQSLLLLRTVQSLASSSHVNVISWGTPQIVKPSGQQTNTFIDEWNLTLRFNAGESQVVDFLYSLGAGNSLIRVSSLELYPGAAGTNLEGSLTLIATYQKKEEPKKPATRVATTPVKRP